MLEQDRTARIRATIEEELGGLRAFAGLPSTELEAMAERIARAIEPLMGELPRRAGEPRRLTGRPALRPLADAKLILRPYYLVRPRLWREPLRATDARSVVSRQWRYVYLRVPKAANTTVLRTLLERFPEPGLDAGDVDRAKVRATHFRNLRAGELAEVAGYFTFTVVRDPYVRVLSAYLDKFRPGNKHLGRFHARVERMDGGQVSFRGFCRYLAAGGEAEDAHWMRQTRLVGLADRVDFVGRVESLAADLPAAMARIGGAAEVEVEIRRAGPPATGASARLAEHYDPECRQIVAEVYAADFGRFGYPLAPG